jgi:hypothetical protein
MKSPYSSDELKAISTALGIEPDHKAVARIVDLAAKFLIYQGAKDAGALDVNAETTRAELTAIRDGSQGMINATVSLIDQLKKIHPNGDLHIRRNGITDNPAKQIEKMAEYLSRLRVAAKLPSSFKTGAGRKRRRDSLYCPSSYKLEQSTA